MSENNSNKFQIDCVQCKQRFSIEFPPMELLNGLQTSVLSAPHPRLSRCVNNTCRQPYTIVITGHQGITFGAVPVNEAAVSEVEGSKIIKPQLELIG